MTGKKTRKKALFLINRGKSENNYHRRVMAEGGIQVGANGAR